ncbi:MAG: hypothetical protein K1X92_11540, partial [Bacteroidia bacterium]|nr:hypothetical protein [Bacteroidia bacterium]
KTTLSTPRKKNRIYLKCHNRRVKPPATLKKNKRTTHHEYYHRENPEYLLMRNPILPTLCLQQVFVKIPPFGSPVPWTTEGGEAYIYRIKTDKGAYYGKLIIQR